MASIRRIDLALPIAMVREIQKVAKLERRTVSEVLMEAFRQYRAHRNLHTLAQAGRRAVKAKGLTAYYAPGSTTPSKLPKAWYSPYYQNSMERGRIIRTSTCRRHGAQAPLG